MERGKTHFMALDGLRGVAALIVLLFHRRWWIAPGAVGHGYLAVDFFFMLSGFVIGYAYEHRLGSGQLSFARFARLRAERLGPLVTLGAILGVLILVLEARHCDWAGGMARAIAALPLAVLTLPVPWLPQPFSVNQPSWSLFYEIAANLMFAAIATRLTDRRLAWLIAATAAGLVGLVLFRQDIYVGWTWHTLPAGLLRVTLPFLAGLGLRRLWSAGHLRGWSAPFWLLAVILVALLMLPPLPRPFDALYVLACIMFAFPVLIALGSGSRPAGLWQRIAALSAELSFPIYILHYPLLEAFDLLRSGPVTHARQTLLVETVSIAIMVLIVSRVFDEPIRRRLASARGRTHPAGGPLPEAADSPGADPHSAGGVPSNFQART